jgi:uncharacterized integral membrane protein
MMKRIQAFALVFLTAAIVIFALTPENLAPVPVTVLVWDFNASVSLLVLVPLLAGLLIGVGTALALDLRWRWFLRRRERTQAPRSEAQEEPAAIPPAAEEAEPLVKDQEEIGA